MPCGWSLLASVLQRDHLAAEQTPGRLDTVSGLFSGRRTTSNASAFQHDPVCVVREVDEAARSDG